MRDAHANLKINDTHFDLVVNHLADTLKELGVNSDLIMEVAEVAESIRDEVLGRWLLKIFIARFNAYYLKI